MPSPEEQRLETFIGSWRTDGETIAQGDTPAAPVHSSDIYEWLPGGLDVARPPGDGLELASL